MNSILKPKKILKLTRLLFIKFVLIAILLLPLFSCENLTNAKNKESIGSEFTPRKVLDEKGALKSIVTANDSGYRHGPVTVFYSSGEKAISFNYVNNVKQGLETKYYKSGTVYRERNYVDGKINGTVSYYYENGTKKATVSYKNNRLGNDLLEYDKKGNPIKTDYKIDFTLVEDIDDYNRPNAKMVVCRLNHKNIKATFYYGMLEDNKYLPTGSQEMPGMNNSGEYIVNNPKPGIEVPVIAKFTTLQGNPTIIQGIYTFK